MQNRAIKYRIYPSAEQKVLFAKTFGCCRKIWNLMLADKITYYQQTQKMLQTTPAQYKKTYPYLKEVDSLALANVQLHLQTAYKNFFRNKKTGFPKFKSAKHCRKSYTTNCQNGSIRIENGRIRIPKAGPVKAVLHRLPEKDWKIKSATISQYGDSAILYTDRTILAIGRIRLPAVFGCLESRKTSLLIPEEIFISSLQMQLYICKRKAVYFFQVRIRFLILCRCRL